MQNVKPKISASDIEVMLIITANLMAHHGLDLAFILDRLEREYATATKKDPVTRAEHILHKLGASGIRARS